MNNFKISFESDPLGPGTAGASHSLGTRGKKYGATQLKLQVAYQHLVAVDVLCVMWPLVMDVPSLHYLLIKFILGINASMRKI